MDISAIKGEISRGVTEFMDLKGRRDKIIPKIQAYEQEKSSLNGQIAQILSAAGVSSIEELAEKAETAKTVFLAHLAELRESVCFAEKILGEIEEKRGEKNVPTPSE